MSQLADGPAPSAPVLNAGDGAGAALDVEPAARDLEIEDDISILVAASRPDIDPCDVVCDALPALSCGDLSFAERAWIKDHTATCSYCANELHRYQNVCNCLDQVYKSVEVGACPVPRFLPTRPVAWYRLVGSPVGELFIAATDDALVEIEFSHGRSEDAMRRHLHERGFQARPLAASDLEVETGAEQVMSQVVRQLDEYFGGSRRDFDLPLDLSGLPDFTRDVLSATARVPYGQLDTYRGIAMRIGKPAATRAVGNALNRNPIPLVVPCHRIIRSDGSAGGYGGGLDVKFKLLEHEGVMIPHQPGPMAMSS
jgi:methylated-DNA-[protein]-cysteine S-methyltransferase